MLKETAEQGRLQAPVSLEQHFLLFQGRLTYNCIQSRCTSVPFISPSETSCGRAQLPDIFPFSFGRTKKTIALRILGSKHNLALKALLF